MDGHQEARDQIESILSNAPQEVQAVVQIAMEEERDKLHMKIPTGITEAIISRIEAAIQ